MLAGAGVSGADTANTQFFDALKNSIVTGQQVAKTAVQKLL